ncbi:MAG: cytochrome c1, partial [Hyphomicrobiales bacterium]|nr:cytochrome c1 [Hyphomicrobiales bacterium]
MTMIASVSKLGRAFGAAALLAGIAFAVPAGASETAHGPKVEMQSWSFAGPFGRFDKAQLQRGYKVYKEVCAACHSMKLVSFRNLADEGGPGFTMDQAKELAAGIQVKDGPNDAGEMFDRPGRASDRFASPFPNDEAARASFGGALPPDLSLIAKARAAHRGGVSFLGDPFTLYAEAGPDYVYNLLLGYKDAPEGVTCDGALQYNESFIGGSCIAMPPPLMDGIVTYDDGSPATAQQYAKDVA